MKKSPQIFWTILFLVIVVLILGFYNFKSVYRGLMSRSVETKNSKTEILPLGEGQSVEKVSLNIKQYKHSILGFSFEYPSEYSISSFGNYFDSTGESILLQKENSDKQLQVIITPFDEDISLSAERIKKDIPKLSIVNPKVVQIAVGQGGISMVVFLSENNLSIGKTIEGWFVYRGNLYQISSPETSTDLFDTIIKSWRLQE